MKHQQGFTIVELMVAIFITTLITIVITDYMMQNTRSSIITSSQQNILREIGHWWVPPLHYFRQDTLPAS